MKKIIVKNLFWNLLAFSLITQAAVAQEVSTRTGDAKRLSTVESRLTDVVTEYEGRINELKLEVDRIDVCSLKQKIYRAGAAGADADGCVNADEVDPHIADFGHTQKEGLPECLPNEFLKSVGPYEFECVDAAPYITPPSCTPSTKTLTKQIYGESPSCVVTLPEAPVESERIVSCSSGKYDITGRFVCKDNTQWDEKSLTVTQTRFDDCREYILDLYTCEVLLPWTLSHMERREVQCNFGAKYAKGTAWCHDGTITISNLEDWESYEGEWVASEWSSCSGECGGGDGIQTRTTSCLADAGVYCNPAERPATEQICINDNACDPVYDGVWETTDWSECSGNCGGGQGVQNRDVSCSGSLCDPSLKPINMQECTNNNSCPVDGVWMTSEWSECSGLCGGGQGIQTRGVTCNGTLCDDSAKPLSERSCVNNDACPIVIDGTWEVTEWGTCSGLCDGGQGIQSREVSCNGLLCDDSTKPVSERPCVNNDACPIDGTWKVTEWSQCSGDCGGGQGTQIREVSCNGLLCDESTKPTSERSCVNEDSCPIDGTWKVTEWSQCSGDCGGGQGTQSREVSCNGLLCDESTKPASERSCVNDDMCPVTRCSGSVTLAASKYSCTTGKLTGVLNESQTASCEISGGYGRLSADVACKTSSVNKTAYRTSSASAGDLEGSWKIVSEIKYESYLGQWITGNWGLCSGECNGGHGIKMRSVSCDKDMCDPDTKPAETQECINYTSCPVISIKCDSRVQLQYMGHSCYTDRLIGNVGDSKNVLCTTVGNTGTLTGSVDCKSRSGDPDGFWGAYNVKYKENPTGTWTVVWGECEGDNQPGEYVCTGGNGVCADPKPTDPERECSTKSCTGSSKILISDGGIRCYASYGPELAHGDSRILACNPLVGECTRSVTCNNGSNSFGPSSCDAPNNCSGTVQLTGTRSTCSVDVGTLLHGRSKTVDCYDSGNKMDLEGNVSCSDGVKTVSNVTETPRNFDCTGKSVGLSKSGAYCSTSVGTLTANNSKSVSCRDSNPAGTLRATVSCNSSGSTSVSNVTFEADQVDCTGKSVSLSASGAYCSTSVGTLAANNSKTVSCRDTSPAGTLTGTVSCSNSGSTSVSNVTFEADAPNVNCVGSWSAWGACTRVSIGACTSGGVYYNFCHQNRKTRTYNITTPASGSGTACPYNDGQTETENCGPVSTGGCFVPGTFIRMENGDLKPIEEVKVGDRVQGADGVVNTMLETRIHNYTGKFYSINGTDKFVTGGHPFKTTEGWKAFNVEEARAINPTLEITQLNVGDILLTEEGSVELKSVDYVERENIKVYNLHLDGTQEYYADGYLVHNK